jgi:HD superfamily phosphodiesterase
LKPEDLNHIPFTLLVPNRPTTIMEHKRCVAHIARKAAESMKEFMGNALKIDVDTVVAGAILADVGKLLEYETVDGPDGHKEAKQSKRVSCCAIHSPAELHSPSSTIFAR